MQIEPGALPPAIPVRWCCARHMHEPRQLGAVVLCGLEGRANVGLLRHSIVRERHGGADGGDGGAQGCSACPHLAPVGQSDSSIATHNRKRRGVRNGMLDAGPRKRMRGQVVAGLQESSAPCGVHEPESGGGFLPGCVRRGKRECDEGVDRAGRLTTVAHTTVHTKMVAEHWKADTEAL